MPTAVSGARRRAILIVFVALCIVGGVLNAVVKRHDRASSLAEKMAVSSVVLGRSASVAWYCPGPLAFGHRGERSLLAVTNVSGSKRTASVRIAANDGLARREQVHIGPYENTTLALPQPSHPAYGAAALVVDGPGVAVNEVTETKAGRTVAPCTTHTTKRAYFGVGSTLGSSNVAISLFNAGATPAVADVSFLTGAAVTKPAVFTGMPIEPGQDVVLFAGHAIPQRRSFSVSVTMVSGKVAIGGVDFKAVDAKLSSSLIIGTPVGRASWWYAPTLTAPAIHEAYWLVNPGTHAVDVTVKLVGSGATGNASLTIGPGSAASYVVPSPPVPGIAAASITVSHGSVVAEREIWLDRHVHATHVRAGAQFPTDVPPGFAVTQGTAHLATTWFVGGGRSDATSSEVVSVMNPNATVARVTVEAVANGHERPVAGIPPIVVEPHGSASVDVARAAHRQSAVSFVLRSTHPVMVGATLYAKQGMGLSAPAPLSVSSHP